MIIVNDSYIHIIIVNLFLTKRLLKLTTDNAESRLFNCGYYCNKL